MTGDQICVNKAQKALSCQKKYASHAQALDPGQDGHRKTKVVEAQMSAIFLDSHLFTMGGDFRRESFKTTNINIGHDYFWSTKDGENADTKERLEWRARNRWVGKLSHNLARY